MKVSFHYVIFFVLSISMDAVACRCAVSSSKEAFEKAASIVLGKVIYINQEAKVQISKVWKSSVPNQITIADAANTICPPHFELNGEYIIYLDTLKAINRQIELLAERIAKLPETIDPKPLIDQLGDLQSRQTKLTTELKESAEATGPEAKLVSFENLEIFRRGLKELIMKGEIDPEMRSKITKLIVHKIEILKDGFEIHFHVGEAHYNQALGKFPSASFFVSLAQGSNPRRLKREKPSDGIPSEGFNFVLNGFNDSHRQLSKNLVDTSSRRLTNGGGDFSLPTH